jgi:hypothetical protein
VPVSAGLTIFDYFNSEVWNGDHAALVLGWRDDQLAPLVELLRPHLSGDLTPVLAGEPTPDMRQAIAACARSLVVDTRLTRQPLRYSRDRDHYGGAKRYRRTDRYYTFHYVTKSIELLVLVGLANHAIGEWLGSGSGGRQSVVWPTPELWDLLEPVIDAGELRGESHEAEVIVLRDRTDKKNIDYIETPETTAMRAEIQAINDALADLELYWLGKQFPIPLLRRVFNGDICRGGRCYCHGLSFQNIRARERLDLELLIDGKMRPVVEIDYANQHAVMAYTEAGLPIPPGDQYEIDGFDRTVVKRAFNVLLNATARHKAIAALSEDLHSKDEELWAHSGLATRFRSECRPFAEAVVSAVEEKHRAITAFFGSDRGAAFMRRDSDMAVRVMLRMITMTGRCPLPVHDSFLVADIDQEALASVMEEVASEEGLPLCLKASGGPTHPVPVPASASLYGGNTL